MLHIVLVHPQIPPNTGNVARLCAGTMSHLHLVGPMGFQLNDKTLKRAGLDYWEHVTWQTYPEWSDFVSQHDTQRMIFFSTKGKQSYTDFTFRDGDYLVFGSETAGLPTSILKTHPDQIVTIPMNGPIRSLNLATSVGIGLYEAIRQIGEPPPSSSLPQGEGE